MKILMTADPMIHVPPMGYGGIERIVDSLVGEYRKRGHIVGLVAKDGSTCAADETFSWPGARVSSRRDTLRNALALSGIVRRFKPDILQSFSRLAFLSAVLPRKLPKVMSYQRHTGPRTIRLAHRFAGKSLRFTGCSEFICKQGRVGGGAWRAIPNFVDLSKIDFVPQVSNDAPLVFLSRVETIKGPDLAIEIARRSGRRLIIAGNRTQDGSEGKFFDEKIAPHLGRDGIEWIGEVGDVQKNRLLGSAAAMLVPIQWDEPFGIVFAEALAAGTPVITCARGALPEIIEPGKTGFFINGLDDGVAAVGRIQMLDRSAGRKVVEEQFSLPVCADQYLGMYAEMTGIKLSESRVENSV